MLDKPKRNEMWWNHKLIVSLVVLALVNIGGSIAVIATLRAQVTQLKEAQDKVESNWRTTHQTWASNESLNRTVEQLSNEITRSNESFNREMSRMLQAWNSRFEQIEHRMDRLEGK